jgi:limonene-1,2-epoxide hydrolase
MVVNRRVDRIVSKNGSQDIEVVGVFFVREGKIKEWSDFIAEAV